jgi:hypothetical protein
VDGPGRQEEVERLNYLYIILWEELCETFCSSYPGLSFPEVEGWILMNPPQAMSSIYNLTTYTIVD